MQRRKLLGLGVGAAAVLALGGGVAIWAGPGLRSGRLTSAGREVFSAVARAVLDGSLPANDAKRRAALQAHLQRLDETLVAFPSSVQSEVSQLLSLLAIAPGRLALAGLRSSWAEASVAEVQSALQGMRTSAIAPRQQAYHALRDLTNAAYFADPSAWPDIGYPGPRPT